MRLPAALSLLFALTVTSPAPARIAANRWIDAADAQRATDACLSLAAKSGWKMHVAVLNGHGDLIRFVGMDGATRTSGVLAQSKARTVFRTGRSTREAGKMDPAAQREFDVVGIAGGLPVTVDGRMVGIVAASGGQPDQDEACSQAAIDAAT